MRRFSNHILISILLIQLLSLKETVWAQQLVIAVEDDAAPWSQKNGTGYANDIVRAAFKAVKQDITLQIVPYSRCKEMAIDGKTPACFNMSGIDNPEFKGKIVFPKIPLFYCTIDYFAKNENVSKIRNQQNLKKGTVVGTVIGYEYPLVLDQLRKKGIIVLEESESEITNLKKLALGRIDYALIVHNETKPAQLLLAKAKVNNKVRIAFNCGKQKVYIGFSTTHPKGKIALKKFDEGMQIISNNGTLKKITEKWQNLALTETNKLNAQ
jgi:polar amino acid transport system substrate-binding protein